MKKKLKIFLVILAIISTLLIISVTTVILQKAPNYPTLSEDIGDYFDNYTPTGFLTRAEIIQDIDSIINYTDSLPIEPYRVITRDEFIKKANEVKAKVNSLESDNIPTMQAFYYMQEIVASIQDGHTSLFPLNWDKTVDRIFPLTVDYIDGRLFVKKDYESKIPNRAEILSINNLSVKKLREDLIKYAPATSPEFRDTVFANRFSLWMEYYSTQSWEVKYISNGSTKTVTLNGVSTDAKEHPQTGPYPELDKEYFESEIKVGEETVPVLEFTDFGSSEWEDFKSYIDNFFTRNKDKKYLVLDVRHHPGGNGDWGYYVLSYLTDNKLQGYKEYYFKATSIQKSIIDYGLKSSYYDMKIPMFLWDLPLYKLVPQDDAYYYIAKGIKEAKLNELYPSKWEDGQAYFANDSVDRFNGKVYLLTSHETFSAGVVLVGLFKKNNLGTIVGRETGGRNHMESDPTPLILPNSRLMYLLPSASLTLTDDEEDRGIIPDIKVDLRADDYIKGIDRDLDKVKELIKENEDVYTLTLSE